MPGTGSQQGGARRWPGIWEPPAHRSGAPDTSLVCPPGSPLSHGPQGPASTFPSPGPQQEAFSRRCGGGGGLTFKPSTGWCWESLMWLHAPTPRPPWLHRARRWRTTHKGPQNSSSTSF